MVTASGFPLAPAARRPSLPVGKRKSQGHDFSLEPSQGERAWLTVPHTAQPSLAPGASAHVHMPTDIGGHLAPVAPGASSAAPCQRSLRDSPRRHVLPGRFIPSSLTAGSCRQPDGAVTSPAARLQPVTLPVVIPAWLEILMAPFPWADCLEVAVLHTPAPVDAVGHHGVSSGSQGISLPPSCSPMFIRWLFPLGSLPKDVPEELLAVIFHPPKLLPPSACLVHADHDLPWGTGSVIVTDDNGLPLIFS